MIDKWMVVGAVLVALSVAPALAADDDVVVFQTVARVAVDADGRPEQVQGAARLPPPLRQFVESTVAGWAFEPATTAGVAVSGVTWVQMSVCAIPEGDGFALSARYVANGPASVNGVTLVDAPRYPREALHAGVSGKIGVTYTVEADGSATMDSIEYPEENEKRLRRYFEQPLQEWVSGMRFEPEELDGRPVATKVRMPVEFTLGLPHSKRERARVRREWRGSPECLAAEGRQSMGQLAAAESPFRLRDPG